MSEKRTSQISTMLGILVGHLTEFFELTIEEAQWVIKHPKEAIAVFIKAIRDCEERILQTWKTIELGTGPKDANAFCQAIERIGGQVSKYARDIMGKTDFTVLTKKITLDLVKLSVFDLGFENDATLKEIYERAISLGLKLLPAEAGPQLRLQYLDQPIGEWLIMAMEPIEDSDGDLSVFGVECGDDGPWLRTRYGRPVDVWDSGIIFVFCK